ncbi:hypothetical protein [Phocaeicola vulgatus]|uniref:hypothetical protein n=1 Tax=Phocaeicola vulgatus TaxID=821 RepID=UPI0034A4CF62
MDKATERLVQAEGTAALLDRGVSVPLKELHIPFCKKPLKPRVVMRRPRLDGLMRLARVYLSLGVTAAEIKKFSKEEDMAFIAAHGKDVSRMIAYTLCRGWWSRHLLVGFTAWWVRNFMKDAYMCAAMRNFVLLLGTEAFTPIIRSVERTNPMRLRLSQGKKKGS